MQPTLQDSCKDWSTACHRYPVSIDSAMPLCSVFTEDFLAKIPTNPHIEASSPPPNKRKKDHLPSLPYISAQNKFSHIYIQTTKKLIPLSAAGLKFSLRRLEIFR